MKLTHRQLELLGDDIPLARHRLDGNGVEGVLEAFAPAPVWAGLQLRSRLPDALRDVIEPWLEAPLSLSGLGWVASELEARGLFAAAAAFWRRALTVAEVMSLRAAVAPLRTRLGLALDRLDRHHEAATLFSVPDHHVRDFFVEALAGHALLSRGRMSEAAQAFRRAMDEAPGPAERAQLMPFVEGHERLIEFEGQSGGLDARDLHYVETGGVLLDLPASRATNGSGYHGELAMVEPLGIARVLARLLGLLAAQQRRPTCVVPAHNQASPISLALAELLSVPHFSHARAIDWDRPLVVVPRMTSAKAHHWHPFIAALPGAVTTFAFCLDWTSPELPVPDVTGLLSSSCRFWWDAHPGVLVPAARQLVAATRSLPDSDLGSLTRYYSTHRRHRLASPLEMLQPRVASAA